MDKKMDNKNFKTHFLEKSKDIPRVLKQGFSAFLENYLHIEGTREERQEAVKLRLNFAAKGLCFSVMAFFFGRAELMFASYPLGTALFCASVNYVPFVYLGLIISSVFVNGLASPLFLAYTLGLLTRFTLSYISKKSYTDSLFREKKAARALLSSVMMLFVGAIGCIKGGFLWFDFFGLITGILAAPLITLLISGALEQKHRFTSYHDAGFLALMSLFVFSLNGYTLLGFSLSAIAAFTVTLYISKECGMLRGGAAGLFAGLAYDPLFSPLFAISGIISGLFWKMGTVYASACALGTGIIYAVYMNGFSTLQTLAPDLLAASLIFTPLAHLELLPKPKMYIGNGAMAQSRTDEIAVKEKQNEGAKERLSAISDSLSSLAEIFYNLSCVEKKPGTDTVLKSVENCFDKYCGKCPRYRICRDENYEESSRCIKTVAMKVYEGKRAVKSDIPESILKKCNRMESIINEINSNYSLELKNALDKSKAEVFAGNYASMSALLTEALNENAKEFEIDEELTVKIKGCARYLNFQASNLCVYGKRRKRIIAGGIDLARVRLGVDEIRRSFERVVKMPLKAPDFSIDGEHISMTMSCARSFCAEYTHASLKKENEDINGDSITFFENNEDYFYSLISDGMGSGRDAALSSRLAGVYLDRMLRAGNKKAQSLSMLNSFLRQKSIECSTTVDLLEIDLLNGEACFIKSGAAPSYVLRGTSVFKIASNTMPVGITKELNAEEVKFKLQDKDVVLMASDGISSSFEDGLWLMDTLANDWARGVSLSEMCEKILDDARERNGERDDMTLGMVRIRKIV